MSLKNQKTLFISALAIILVTVGGLIALNYTVEKISQITPPQALAMAPPPQQRPPMRMPDDERRRRRPPTDARMPMDQFRGPPQGGGMRMQPPPLRRGRSDQPLERVPSQDPSNMRNDGGYPPMYQPPQGYPGPQGYDRYDDRDYGEPSYYPPPYDDYFDEDYPPEYDPYGGYDPQGLLDAVKNDPKMAKDLIDPSVFELDSYTDHDREVIDDYLNEFYGE